MSATYKRGAAMVRIKKAAMGTALALGILTLCPTAGFAQQAVSTAGATSGSNSTSLGLQGNQQVINYNDPASQTIKNVPNVYAPGLAAAGSEVCLGSASAGGAAAGFGLTLGGTLVDRECQLRLNARTLAILGYPGAARETMCLDPDVRQAMLLGGTPCAADRAVWHRGKALVKNEKSTDPSKQSGQVALLPLLPSGGR
jgi:hypothetical protein